MRRTPAAAASSFCFCAAALLLLAPSPFPGRGVGVGVESFQFLSPPVRHGRRRRTPGRSGNPPPPSAEIRRQVITGAAAMAMAARDSGGDEDEDGNRGDGGGGGGGNPMAGGASRLSHAMLRVPSVDAAAGYWTGKGGRITSSRPANADADADANKPNGGASGGTLASAFVELGCAAGESDGGGDRPACFALELVTAAPPPRSGSRPYSIGNAISYIGVSMLLQFRDRDSLLGLVAGDEKPEPQGEEPNGIPVRSSASAPGDYLARLALRTNDLAATDEFYTSVLGMENKAGDETMVCLRYDSEDGEVGGGGVPTTLVFDAAEEELDAGDCFDHLAIETGACVEGLHERFRSDETTAERIFMPPTDMFGRRVMGLLDPNGYKVVLFSPPPP